MKTILLFKSVVVIIVIIFSLSSNNNIHGVVIDKLHSPANTIKTDSYSIILDAPMMEVQKIPEKFYILVEVGDETKKVCVTQEIYNSTNKGDGFKHRRYL